MKPQPMLRIFGLMTIVALLLVLALVPAHARDVPFPTKHTVDDNFGGAWDVVTADIDGDGDLDILGGATTADDVAWWENTTGDGSTWSKHIVDGNYNGAQGVAATDMDGDGDQDIVAAAFWGNEVAWWENTAGDGSAWSKHSVDSDFYQATNVAVADVDGDGDMDVLATGYDSKELAWWENTAGDGSAWSKHFVTENFYDAWGVVAVDIDRDGDLDVLASAFGVYEIAWFENTAGDGSAWSKHNVATDFYAVRGVDAVDVDGDGDLDVLGASGSDDKIAWFENTAGDGSTWSAHTVGENFDGAWDVAGADVDGDGDIDVLGAATDADDITWWENVGGDGSAWNEHALDGDFDGTTSVAAADVDGDGDLDVLGAAVYANEIAWWENETIHRSALYPATGKIVVDDSFDGARSVSSADVDGDGDLDILGAADSDDDITWFENTVGDGSAWDKHTVASSFDAASDVAAADLDGDGDLDLLGAGWYANEIAWWENTAGDGSAWHGHAVVTNFEGAASVDAADLDGDGDLDLLGAAEVDNDITWWENTAGDASAWSKHDIDADFKSADAVVAADVDGDGDLDVLGGSSELYDPYSITWWENVDLTGPGTGDGSAWSKHDVDVNFYEVRDVAAADVDGDGDIDILGAAKSGNEIAWWENTVGDGSAWSKHSLDSDFGTAQSVAAADLDVDGDLDILGASMLDNEIAWWENVDLAGPGTGDGSAWSKHFVTKESGEYLDAAAADVDGDGDPDVLGAAWYSDEIIWWQNLGGQFALATADTAPTQLASGESDDLLKFTMTHIGHSGDGDEELATLELLFEESEGSPLTSAAANAVIGKLDIYLDDGSGDFEIGSDTLVTTVDTLELSDGIGIVTLPDGDANVQVQYDTPRTYFVVVHLAADAYAQTAIHQFRITHITEGSSTAEDRGHDIPLILEYAANVSSSEVSLPRPRIWDGGGATENWSEAANWVDDILPADAYDGVYFNDTSSKNAIIDAAFGRTPAGVIISPEYTGQITQDADLSVIEGWHQDGGTFTGGGSTLDIGGGFDLSGGSFTAPSGLMSVGGGFHHTGGTFDPNGGRVVLDNTTDQTLSTTFHDLVLNDGLLGYWKLDEGTGTTAADSSGYGYDGTLQVSPSWSTDIPATMAFNDPHALHFDRNDADHVSISGTDAIDDMQQLTLATWVKLDTMPADHIMRFVTLTNEKAVLRYDGHKGTGPLHFYMKIDGSLHGISATDVLSTGAWLHVAGTYDGSTMRLYLNGVELDTNTISGTVGTGDGIRFGWSAGGEALDGLLDDVRVYNRALPVMEISDLADGKHPQTAIATTTLGEDLDVDGNLILNSGTLVQGRIRYQAVGHWNLDEGSGATAADSSGNGNAGTLVGGPTWTTDTSNTHFSNTYALDFDGVDDYVTIDSVADDISTETSIAFWVKAPSDSGSRYLVSANTADKANVMLLLLHDNIYQVYDGGSSAREGNTDTVVADDTWHHLAYTTDDSTGRLYVDGVEKATHTPDYNFSSDDLWSLAQEWDASGPSDFLNGLMDDVRIYDQVLSVKEIGFLADGYDRSLHDITIGGDFIRNGGVFEAGGGMVTFDGSSPQTLDTDTVTLYDMTVNAGSTLVMQRDTSVEGTLTNNGTLQQSKDVDGSADVAFFDTGGYGGLTLNANSSDLGSTIVKISGNQDCTSTAGESVQRCFDISPANVSGRNAAVSFYFADSELSGNTCSSLDAYHWNGATWDTLTTGSRACSSEPYSLQATGVSDFSPFVLKSSEPCTDPVIPTNMSIDLTGTDNRDVQLGWDDNIANVGGYDVHRSTSPYFTPESSSWFWSLPAGDDSYTNTGAAGSANENYYYVVLGLSNCDVPSDFEKRVGEFDFALVPGTGATITVNTTDDELNNDGDCSLREAIQAANTDSAVDACTAGRGADIIIVPTGVYTLTLAGTGEDGNASGDLDITSIITIDGDGAGSTFIQAGTDDTNGIDRVFHLVDYGGDLTLDSVTVRYGNSCAYGGGGGVNNSQGTLTIKDSTLSDNYCGYGGGGGVSTGYGTVTIENSTISDNSTDDGGVGGGVYTWGTTVSIVNSTISGNSAEGEGGGMYVDGGGTVTIENSTISGNASTNDAGGGISNSNKMTIRNSTISGNTAAYYGGGIEHNESTLTIEHSTIIGNTISDGEGAGVDNSGTLNLKNSIIAGNGTGSGPSDDCDDADNIISLGYNLVGDGTGCPGDGTGDQTTSDPKLGSLQDNGGPTYTHALLSGSPALDQIPDGVNGCGTHYTRDQRGESRPQNGMCDTGALELVAATITVTTTDDELNSDGDCSLREAIQAANSNSAVDACPAGADDDTIIVPAGVYTLAIAGTGEDDNATGDLDITSPIIIDADHADSTIIQAGTDDTNGIDRVFHLVNSSSALTLEGVTVRYGNSCAYGGGGAVNNDGEGTVTIENSILTANYCGYGGGGGVSSLYGTVTIENSTLSDNSTDDGGAGGGVYTWGTTVTILNSTISGNSAEGEGGGMYVDGGGTVTIENSTISANASTNDAGGGISSSVEMTIRNSTISGNTAAYYGGGIEHNDGTLTIEHSTITGNTISDGKGAGVDNFGTMNLKNTIIAGNGTGSGPSDDCDDADNIISLGYNLVGDGTGCPSDGTDDQTTSDPKLGSLQDNGGPTYTHALLSGSPALDQIADGVNGCGTDYTSDQRGESRPQGVACDVGAFELVVTVMTSLMTANH